MSAKASKRYLTEGFGQEGGWVGSLSSYRSKHSSHNIKKSKGLGIFEKNCNTKGFTNPYIHAPLSQNFVRNWLVQSSVTSGLQNAICDGNFCENLLFDWLFLLLAHCALLSVCVSILSHILRKHCIMSPNVKRHSYILMAFLLPWPSLRWKLRMPKI